MTPKRRLRLTADLDVIPFSSVTPPDDMGWLLCLACRLALHRHQPDQQTPSRLLGTCEGCGRWYLILMKPDITSALMVALPEGELFRSAWDDHGGPDGMGEKIAPDGSSGSSGGGGTEVPFGEGLIEVHAP
jgi:hypothetical protein